MAAILLRMPPLKVSRIFASAMLVALTAAPCMAQYTVKRLVFQDAPTYKQDQLEAIAGLKPGQHIGTKEMGEASQRLMDTGVFADIETTVDGPFSAISVVFKLKPGAAGGWLPVSFENLVWLTPEERDAGLRSTVPLYTGRLPEAGTMQAAVQTALTAMLQAKGVQAKVETELQPSTETRPMPLVAYHVSSPTVMLAEVKLQGVSTALAAAERTVLSKLVKKPYNEGYDAPLDRTLLQPYLDAGYIDARLDSLTRTPVVSADGKTVNVTVSASIAGGEVYRVASITWPGSEFFSQDDFTRANKLHPGDVASDTLLRQSYKPLLNAYLKRGYVDVSIDTQPKREEAAHKVAYTLRVTPGEVYKVGSVSIVGLKPADRARFDALWTQPVGSIYDAVEAFALLPRHKGEPWMDQYNSTIVTTANPDTKLVDIVFTFAPAS